MKDQAEKEPELQLYVPHLQNNTILRLLQQVWVKKMFVTMRKLESAFFGDGFGWAVLDFLCSVVLQNAHFIDLLSLQVTSSVISGVLKK